MAQEPGVERRAARLGAAVIARLRSAAHSAGRLYLRIGGTAGGVLGVVAFVAVWALCIANFGLVFGVALGWIPGVVIALPVSIAVRLGWAPLLVAIALLATAPRWDHDGHVRRATAAVVAQARDGLGWMLAQARQKADEAEVALRREGLWP